ncbi:SDR family NAD(P)-dependent oxidoreductase [Naasia sp. SYSU D00948]|uniref:SDR family NAD(P)-dependent oxidoreductase n=1 Tax=Naasia sp. SYSU D00948 TaxID=2817379 RepID=UPI001B30C0F0|nr:SDR family NAD(P)-dependent oxidoreductase [Naasia sp. SYSU D00948]
MARRLRGSVVVLVGASSGIGRATALLLAEHGVTLALAARSAETLEEVARECRARGGRAIAVPTDVSDESQVERLVRTVVDEFGRIDAWVGLASVFAYGRFEDTPREVFRQQLETNLFGQVFSARAVLPVFRSQGGGHLVFVASVYSRVTSPYASGYITSKHALFGFAEVLREEIQRDGIAVSTVLPSTIDTPIYQHAANYSGREAHPLPPIVAPERAAAAILRVLRRPRRTTVVGRTQGMLVPVRLLAPALYARLVPPVMDLIALRRGGVAPSPGNVFDPQPELNAVSGDWRWPAPVRLLPLAAIGALALVARRRRTIR